MTQTRDLPLIVGDRYELAETVASTYGGELASGLLAKPAYGADPLPMSGYEKSPIADPNGNSPQRRRIACSQSCSLTPLIAAK